MIYSRRNVEIVLSGSNTAYKVRRQHVLNGFSTEMVPRQRLEAVPALAISAYRPTSASIIKRILRIVAGARKELY